MRAKQGEAVDAFDAFDGIDLPRVFYLVVRNFILWLGHEHRPRPRAETAPIKRRIVSAANGALRALRRALPAPRKVCVIPPSGAGSLGDQAMMEVVRRVLSARFGLEASFLYEPRAIAATLGEDCRHVVLSSSKARFAQMTMATLRSSHVVYLATDTLDGSYGPHSVNAWLRFVENAGRAGAKIGVLNFSFSESPDPSVRDRLGAMSGAYFSVRDDVSLARFARSTGQTAVLGADIGFLLEPTITSQNAAVRQAGPESRGDWAAPSLASMQAVIRWKKCAARE